MVGIGFLLLLSGIICIAFGAESSGNLWTALSGAFQGRFTTGALYFLAGVVCVILCAIFVVIGVRHIKKLKAADKPLYSSQMLAEGGIMIAAAMVLGFLKIFELPQGGSVCLGMLPILFFCVRWGLDGGMLCSIAYGLLQLIFDGAYAWGWTSMLLDYVVAFGVLGFAGLFARKRGGIFAGTVLGCVLRFIVHFVSGITIYRIYEPVELFNTTFANPYLYSAAYNGSYVFIDMVLCLVIFAVLYKPLQKYFLGRDLEQQ